MLTLLFWSHTLVSLIFRGSVSSTGQQRTMRSTAAWWSRWRAARSMPPSLSAASAYARSRRSEPWTTSSLNHIPVSSSNREDEMTGDTGTKIIKDWLLIVFSCDCSCRLVEATIRRGPWVKEQFYSITTPSGLTWVFPSTPCLSSPLSAGRPQPRPQTWARWSFTAGEETGNSARRRRLFLPSSLNQHCCSAETGFLPQ